jgi:hypothetical protein
MSRMYPVPGVPGSPSRKPRTSDYIAAISGLGSGRSFDRGKYIIKRIQALREAGHEKEAALLSAALDKSIRGAYEIARLSEEAFFYCCKLVDDGFGRNLLEARRFYREVAAQGRIDGIKASEPVTVSRCKDGMYRISSLHNHSSVLVSASDLLYLGELIGYLMPELQEGQS